MFQKLDSPISLAFLARYPSPQDARGLGQKRLAAFLQAHRYSSHKNPAELLGRLRCAPAGRAGEIETRARRAIVLRVTETLKLMVEQIAELEAEIAHALDAHPDGEIFRSFFRSCASVICAATLLAEIGDCRGRDPHRDAIVAHAGHAPVAVESGKHKTAKFRWACNKRLRNALAWLAHSSRRWNPWAADGYANARVRGHKHTRALRTLRRAWGRTVWSCWQHHIPYDPKRHSGLQQHATVTIPTPTGPPARPRGHPADDALTTRAAGKGKRAALDGKPTSANALGG